MHEAKAAGIRGGKCVALQGRLRGSIQERGPPGAMGFSSPPPAGSGNRRGIAWSHRFQHDNTEINQQVSHLRRFKFADAGIELATLLGCPGIRRCRRHRSGCYGDAGRRSHGWVSGHGLHGDGGPGGRRHRRKLLGG